jgi:hypothetical protein
VLLYYSGGSCEKQLLPICYPRIRRATNVDFHTLGVNDGDLWLPLSTNQSRLRGIRKQHREEADDKQHPGEY